MNQRAFGRSVVVGALGAAVTLLLGCIDNVNGGDLVFDGGHFDFDAGPTGDAFAPDATLPADSAPDVASPPDDVTVNPADASLPPHDAALPDVAAEASPAEAGPGDGGTDSGFATISDLAAAGGPENVVLTWTALAGATGYNLYEATTSGAEPALGSPTSYSIQTTGTTTLTFTVPSLSAGAVYYASS